MMFIYHNLNDQAFQEYEDILKQSGLLTLAKTVTRMCQMYLGLTESITWCADVDDKLCEELMGYILDQGNFGHKRQDDKAAKVLTRYKTPIAFLKGMQRKGLYEWEAAKHHKWLRPLAWMYVGWNGCRQYFTRDGRKALLKNQRESKRRDALFKKLY